MESLNIGWLALFIFTASLGISFTYLSKLNKNKKVLMFGISFITSSICYILIAFDIEHLFYGIYQWTAFPIMIAILICAIESIFKIKSFTKLFKAFIVTITATLIAFVILPEKVIMEVYLVRIPLAISIIAMLIYLFFSERELSNFLFLMAILCYTTAGISQSRGDLPLSLYSYFVGYIFISIISFSEYQPKRYGVNTFLNLKRELELTKRKLSKVAEEQKIILENIPAMVYLKDEKGRFVRVNKSFYEFMCEDLGVECKDVTGKKAEDIFPEKYLDLFSEDEFVLKTGQPKTDILKSIYIDGRNIWLNMDKIPYTTYGKVRGLVCIADDVTDNIEKERLLRESRERFRTLAETAPFAIIVYQEEDIMYVNRATENITGFSRRELMRKKFWELIHPDFRDAVKKNELDRQKGKTLPPYECKIVARDGTERWVQVTGGRMMWNGMPASIVTVVDITDIKNFEEYLKESERKFRILAENSPIDILVIQDERFVYANFDVAKVTGYSREEILSKNFLDIIHPEFKEKFQKKYLDTLSGKRVPPAEYKVLSKNGEEKWALIGGSLIDWEGKPSVLVVISDITDRKRAEEEAVRAKRYMENILHAAGDGIRIVGLNYKVKMLNRRMARMAKVRMKEGVGMRCSDMFRAAECGTEDCSLRRVLRTGRGFQKESLRYSTDGKAIPCLQMVTPLKDAEGNIVGIIEDFRDIRIIKRAEERLRKAHEMLKRKKEQLEKLNNLKSLFLNITSHELRTPMAAIKGYAQLLEMDLSDKLDEKQKNILHTIVRNIDRLDRLINDILDVSRLESGTLKIVPEKCRIEEIIDRAIETMRGQAQMKDIKIEKLVEYDLPELFIDKYRMEQVVTNLLSNAIKFSNRNSRIIVRASKKGDKVVLEIQDFGRGIPKNKLKKIFEPFYQVDSGMDRKFGGAGLGLTIVKGIVEAHGGNIEVESKVREGTTFRIILPTRYIEKERKIEIFSRK